MKKLVLAYVDSLRTDMLRRAISEGRAPTFGRLVKRGVLIEDCVSSFPSVTPVASAEMVTGVAGDRHWISGMNWYHRVERRYVEYGSSLEASRAESSAPVSSGVLRRSRAPSKCRARLQVAR